VRDSPSEIDGLASDRSSTVMTALAPSLFRRFLIFAMLMAMASLVVSRFLKPLARPFGIGEMVVIAIIAIVPVLKRWQLGGVKTLTEPLCIFSGAVVVFYVIRGAELFWRSSVPEPDALLKAVPATDADLSVSLAYVLLGLCIFHVAYRFWDPPGPALSLRAAWEPSRLRTVGLLGILAASASTFAIIAASGGIGEALSHFSCLRMVTAGYGYLLLGISYWSILFAFLLRARLEARKSIWLPLACLGMSTLCDLAMGNRTGIMCAWTAGFLLYVYQPYRLSLWRSSAIATAILVGLVALGVPVARLRENVCFVPPSPKVAAIPTPASIPQPSTTAPVPPGNIAPAPQAPKPTLAARIREFHPLVKLGELGPVIWGRAEKAVLRLPSQFVALDSFATVIACGPKTFPFRYGGTYLDGVLFVVPRFLWPNKPRSFAYAIGKYLQGVETAIPPGFIGELYINFHVAGVAVGMYLLGLLLRWVHRWLLSGDSTAVAACLLLIPYLIVLVGGSFLGSGTLMLIPLGLMLPIIWYMDRRRSDRPSTVLVTWSSDFSYPQPQRRCNMYARRGYRTLFVGWDRDDQAGDAKTIDGVECHFLMRGFGYHSMRAATGLLLWMGRLFWLALRADVDAIHVFDFDSAVPVGLACRLRRLPFIYDVFDNYELRYHWPRLVRKCIAWMDRRLIHWAAAVIVPDENRIAGAVAAERAKVKVVYPCPPDSGLLRHPDESAPFTVHAGGFLGLCRGLGLLLDAAEALPDLRFILNGNIREQVINDRVLRLPNVRYEGYLRWDKAVQLASECDIEFAFFDPAYEINICAAPQKLYEGMMAGRPVLMNSELMKAPWVEREKIGFTCPYDSKALEACLRHLAAQRGECRARGERGRHLFEAEYNWQEMEKRLYAAVTAAIPSRALLPSTVKAVSEA